MLASRLTVLFQSVMTADNAERKIAETEIHEMAGRSLDAFVESCLLIVAARESITPSIRLMAIATLKQLTSDQKFQQGAYGSQLFQLLLTEDSDTVANMIAAVVALCTSDLQNRFNQLRELFQEDFSTAQKNGLKCLNEMIDLLPPSTTTSLCPLLANLLLLARRTDHVSQQVMVMNACQKLANSLVVEYSSVLAPVLESHAGWILDSSLSSTSQNEILLELSLHFQRLVEPVLDCLPHLLSKNYLMQLLEVLQRDVNGFVTQAADCENFSVRGKIISRRWELVAGFYRRKAVPECAAEIVTELAPDLFNLIVAYSQATPDLLEEWTELPNKLLEQESDREDHVSWSTRDVVIDLAQMLVKRFSDVFIPVVMNGIHAVLAAGNSSPWTVREGALCLLQHLVDTRAKTLSKFGVTDLNGLIQLMVAEDLNSSNCIVAARAVLLVNSIMNSSRYFNIGSDSLTKKLLPACLSTMENTASANAADVVSACSSKLLLTLTKHCDSETLLTSLERGITLLLRCIGRTAVADDYLYLVIEVLTQWISHGSRAGKQFNWSPSVLQAAPETIVSSWKVHIQDPNVAGLMVELLDAIVESEECDASMTRVFPWMGEVLGGQASAPELCIVPQILNVVTSIFNKSSGPLALHAANCFADPLCQVLLCSDDTSTISSACSCFVGLIRRAGAVNNCAVHVSPALLQNEWSVELPKIPKLDDEQQTVTLTEALVAITWKILSPDRNEISLLNSGGFLEAVAKCGEQMNPGQLEKFLSIVVRRALDVRTDTAFQQLLLPISTILCWNIDTFLSLCDRTVLPLLQKWLPRQEQVTEALFAERSTRALEVLLCSLPQSLSNQVIRWKCDDVKGRGVTIRVPAAIFAALCKSVLTLSSEYPQASGYLSDDDENCDASDVLDVIESSDDGDVDDQDEESAPNQLLVRNTLIQMKGLRSFVPELGPEIQSLFSLRDVQKLTAFFETG